MFESKGARHLCGPLVAMLLMGAGAPALAAEAAAPAQAQQDVEESRLPDWRVLALACAGLVVGRVVVMRRAKPRSGPRR